MTVPDPFYGVITAADVYAKVEAVHTQVRSVEQKVDLTGGTLADLRTHVIDHEERIRRLESERWPHGKMTALLALAGVVIAVVSLLMKG